MQLKNLECQLAMAQFKRYSAGAKLSDEALEALESHLVDCPDCQKAVQAFRPAPSPATHAVVETPAPTPAPNSALPATSTVSGGSPFAVAQLKKVGGQGNAKTLVLSISLGLVLVAMSTLANDPTKLFGERAMKPGQSSQAPLSATPAITPVVASAAATNPATPASSETSPTADREPPVRAPEQSNEEAMREAPPARPSVTESPRRAAPVRRTAPRRTTRTTRATTPRRATAQPTTRRAAAPRPASNSGIRVYDENGRLIR